jgi:glycosyltransferase involved in cell wall biosynthesis
MENTFDISVILPLHSKKIKDFDELFKKAIDSLIAQKVVPSELLIVHTNDKSLVEFLDSYDFGSLNVKKVQYEGENNFSSQVNLGVKNASNSWVSFFEFDDVLSIRGPSFWENRQAVLFSLLCLNLAGSDRVYHIFPFFFRSQQTCMHPKDL